MNKLLEQKINSLYKNTKAIYLSEDILYQGSFITLLKEAYQLPNGKVINRERIIKNKGKEAVIVIAITNDNKFILVAQNRINQITSIEFPSGYIEEKETIEEAAMRELKEETGYISNHIELLDSYQNQIGIDSSVVNIVIAYDCKKVSEQNLGINEYINFMEFSFEELCELIHNDVIKSVGNKLAFYKFLTIFPKKTDL